MGGDAEVKITLELPDSTHGCFINFICYDDCYNLRLVSKGIGTKDIEAGYKDCREYEVSD